MSNKTFNLRKIAIAAAAATGLLAAAPVFGAVGTGPGSAMGPGMMGGGEQECDMGPEMRGSRGHDMGSGMMRGHQGGPGAGMMGGYGHGYGMGAGMMGGSGYGMGSGMMGGYGNGYGMGPGMMGGSGHGYGMGPGMMGFAGAPGLNLTQEQQTKVRQIHDASRKKMWGSMGDMLDASSKLRELLAASARDRAAISAAYKQVAEARQKMFELGLDAREEFERALTADQRKQLGR